MTPNLQTFYVCQDEKFCLSENVPEHNCTRAFGQSPNGKILFDNYPCDGKLRPALYVDDLVKELQERIEAQKILAHIYQPPHPIHDPAKAAGRELQSLLSALTPRKGE